jgi:transcriptional antiterminator RfaH
LNWYVLYTKARWEKKVFDRLTEDGFNAYCPLQIKWRQWSDRIKKVEFPIFPSYVFVNCDLQAHDRIRRISGVVNFVYWLGKPATIKETEFSNIRNFVSDYSEYEINFKTLHEKDEIYIQTGPFKENKATIVKIGKHKAILELKQLNLKIEVKIKTK